jgi:hypothetical protein
VVLTIKAMANCFDEDYFAPFEEDDEEPLEEGPFRDQGDDHFDSQDVEDGCGYSEEPFAAEPETPIVASDSQPSSPARTVLDSSVEEVLLGNDNETLFFFCLSTCCFNEHSMW